MLENRAPGRTLIVALAAMTLALAACSDDGGGTDGGGDPAATTVSAQQYADDVCGALNAWLADIQATVQNLEPATDPDSGQEALAAYFDEVVGVTEDMAAAVELAGVPDADGGEQVASQINGAMDGVVTALEDVRTEVDSLPSDPAGFQQAAADLQTQIQTALPGAVAPLNSIANPEVDQAFSESTQCQALSGASPAP
jgi:hypothetical protein